MNFKKRIITAAATGSLLFFSITPAAFADTNITINGNLQNSDNTATVTTTNTSTVKQDNTATVNNNVNSNSNTGKNTASDNTGGNVSIGTGDSTSKTNVTTQANMNQATVPNCNCGSSTDVQVSDNGKKTDNTANVTNTNTQTVFQNNDANVKNNVYSDGNTGKNNAGDNGGNVHIGTGDSKTETNVSTAVNTNVVMPATGSTGSNGTVSAKIVGNLEKSDNSINLDLANSATVVQNNDAWVDNHVKSDSNTGYNSANDNTGGSSVSIGTGDSTVKTNVSNMANFNSADLDCGCLLGVTAKVADNGKKSDNNIDAALDNSNSMFQTNDAGLNNKVDGDGNTGKNSAHDNGGLMNGDPSITTQDSTSTTNVNNEANQNMVGGGSGEGDSVVTLPGGGTVSVNFDLSALLHFLGLV